MAKEYCKINKSNSCVINNRLVPLGAVYGKYRGRFFICYDTSQQTLLIEYSIDEKAWKKAKLSEKDNLHAIIKETGNNHAVFGTKNGENVTVYHHGPAPKRPQAATGYIRFKGSCYSQRAIDGKLLYGDDKEVKFNPSRNGIELDRTKGRKKDERPKISGEIKSHKFRERTEEELRESMRKLQAEQAERFRVLGWADHA